MLYSNSVKNNAFKKGIPSEYAFGATLEEKKVTMKNALTALLVSAVKCKGNKEVDEGVDEDRAGIVVFRIP